MSLRAIFSAGLRLIGLYWLIETLFRLKDIAICLFFPEAAGSLSGLNYVLNGVDLLIMLLLFFFCTIRTDWVMRLLRVPQDAGDDSRLSTEAMLLSVGLTLLGVYYLVISSTSFIDSLVKAILIQGTLINSRGKIVMPWPLVLPYAFQLAVCLYLVFGTKSFVRWWCALRELPDTIAKRICDSSERPT
jgi:hypothetical protein